MTAPSAASVFQVWHTSNVMKCYPGETITLNTRLVAGQGLAKFKLQVSFTNKVVIISSECKEQHKNQSLLVVNDQDTGYLIWNIQKDFDESVCLNFQINAQVRPTSQDVTLASKAEIVPEDAGFAEKIKPDEVHVLVRSKSSLLKYLPNIYQDDDLMGRFLMLFDSFIAPIEGQINAQYNYFDPFLTPVEFLPWLASWSGIVLDEAIPECRRRRLLKEAARLFKLRGTRRGLKDYLELYSGGKAQIDEHFSENFTLNPRSYLGPGIALGTINVPNTFHVSVKVPPDPADDNIEMRNRRLRLLESKIEAIIEMEKPVHTGYELIVEIDPMLRTED